MAVHECTQGVSNLMFLVRVALGLIQTVAVQQTVCKFGKQWATIFINVFLFV